MTRPYAEVIGDPIAHSKSPLIHNFWLQKLGIDAEYRATHVRAEELEGYFTQRRKDAEWRGCNVTMPHKVAAQSYLDDVLLKARRIGAVNCVVARQDGLIGANTDLEGFLEPLPSKLVDGPTAIIVGGGGAARAVAVALWENGWRLIIANRSRDKARAIADAVAGPGEPSSFIETPSLLQLKEMCLHPKAWRIENLALVVNASAMGMTGRIPLDLELGDVPSSMIVYDLVYQPLQTPLLKGAKAKGLRTIDGLAMLIGQAAIAFAQLFGAAAPREHDTELRALLVT